VRWGVRLELGDWAGPVVLAFTTGNGQVRREEAFPVAVQLTHEPVARDDVAAGARAGSVPVHRIVRAESGKDPVWHTLDKDVRIIERTGADRHGRSLRVPFGFSG